MSSHKQENQFTVSNNAQMTVTGLMMVFLGLMVLGSLMPTIADTSTDLRNNLTSRNYIEEGVLARLIPLFIVVTFLATIALYGSPQT